MKTADLQELKKQRSEIEQILAKYSELYQALKNKNRFIDAETILHDVIKPKLKQLEHVDEKIDQLTKGEFNQVWSDL